MCMTIRTIMEQKMKTVKTNSDGKWESELCPAGYKVTVKSETLPEGYKLSSEDVLGLTVNADNEIENFNIAVQTEKENSNWNWLWILLLVLILGSFGLYYYRSRRRN
jgi:hypothetical protein